MSRGCVDSLTSILRVLPAIFVWPASASTATAMGVGFLASSDGRLITCCHAMDGARRSALRCQRQLVEFSEPAPPTGPAGPLVAADTSGLMEEEQVEDGADAARLRRAREQQELRRTEAIRRLEMEQARQREISRLQALVSSLVQIESSLHHQVVATQQELASLSKDPASISAIARRADLESRLSYLHTQWNQATTSKQAAMRQLSDLQIR